MLTIPAGTPILGRHGNPTPKSTPQKSEERKPRSWHGYSAEVIAGIAKDFVEEYGPEVACTKAIDLLEAAASANAARKAIYEMENSGEIVPFKKAVARITLCDEYEYARERYRDFLTASLGLLIADEKGFEYLGIVTAGTPSRAKGEIELDYEPLVKEALSKQRKEGLGALQVELLRAAFKAWDDKTSKKGRKN